MPSEVSVSAGSGEPDNIWHSSTKIHYIAYQCSQCGAVDRGKFFPDENQVNAINCWNCHAGMRGKNGGMLRLGEVSGDGTPEEALEAARRGYMELPAQHSVISDLSDN